MTTIGSYQAKTHFSELLERVRKGEEIVITRRGVPIARWTPHRQSSKDIKEAFRKMRELRRGNRLGKDLTIRDLIEEGRRF